MKFNEEILYFKNNDPIIAEIIKRIGPCTLTSSKNYFLYLVKSIIHQQISLKAGETIYTRFVAKLNHKVIPENVLNLTEEDFKQAGVSSQKKSYLIDLSNKFIEGFIDTKTIHKMSDEELIEQLTKIRGIGRWTAEMFLIFSLNRPDVLPLDDIGFKRAVMINYRLRIDPSREKIIKISKKWGQYKTFAVWYLWQSLNTK